MKTMEKILIVIDSNSRDKKKLKNGLARLLSNNVPLNAAIDIISFSDISTEEIKAQVKLLSSCKETNVIDAVACVERTKNEVREGINKLLLELREHLVFIAKQTYGEKWSQRFGELWWYTFLTGRNTTAFPLWWTFFHFEAVRVVIDEGRYKKCLLLGTKPLNDLLYQLNAERKNNFKSVILERIRMSPVKMILKRWLGLFGALLVIFLSTTLYKQNTKSRRSEKGQFPKVFLYSYFPRVWTYRCGKWQDMYWGNTFDELESKKAIEPVYILFLLDRWNFLVRYFINRVMRLRDQETKPRKFIVFESYGRLKDAIKEYVNFRDILNFRHITSIRATREKFKWGSYNIYNSLSLSMWESVIVWWPAFLLMRQCATTLSKEMKPAVSMLPFFEYLDMRAIACGIRRGTQSKILGIQHGPITFLRMTTAGAKEELIETKDGGMPFPQLDIYAVDGALAKDILALRGISEERIRTIGAPRFDEIWAHAKKSSLIPKFQNNKVTLLIAPGLHDTEFMLHFVLTAINGDPRFKILIKLHPKVISVKIEQIIRSYVSSNNGKNAEIAISRDGEIYKCMEASDIMLTTYSSTGVEAIAFGLSVILLKSKRMPDISPLAYEGSPVLSVSEPSDLKRYIDSLVNNQSFRKKYLGELKDIVNKNYAKIDSSSSARLATVCEQLALCAKH